VRALHTTIVPDLRLFRAGGFGCKPHSGRVSCPTSVIIGDPLLVGCSSFFYGSGLGWVVVVVSDKRM